MLLIVRATSATVGARARARPANRLA